MADLESQKSNPEDWFKEILRSMNQRPSVEKEYVKEIIEKN